LGAFGWWLLAVGRWLVAGGWWLVAGGWWLVAGQVAYKQREAQVGVSLCAKWRIFLKLGECEAEFGGDALLGISL
jgi:hypothetical protein